MAKKQTKITDTIAAHVADANIDVDLTPVLGLMVCLIPIMLIGTVFVRIVVIETPLPQVVQEALDKDREQKERSTQVALKMGSDIGFVLEITQNGKSIYKKAVPRVSGQYDLANLRKEFLRAKEIEPSVFRLDLHASTDVIYNEIVRVMDEARRTKEGEQKIKILDEKTKEFVETDLLYPDVFFANVMEG